MISEQTGRKHRIGVPYPPLVISEYTVDLADNDWIGKAADLLRTFGFVIIPNVLRESEIESVKHICDTVAAELLEFDPHAWGNRGCRRYSFGEASLTRHMAHHWSFTKHLLDNEYVRQLVDDVFHGKVQAWGAGGEFVLGDTHEFQDLHSDVGGPGTYDTIWPPPHLVANFVLEDQTASFGPTRIIPGSFTRSRPYLWEEHASHQSLLCPVPRGAAILRDARTLHSGSPNKEKQTRYLPNAEYLYCGTGPVARDLYPCIPANFFQHISSQLTSWSHGLELAEDAERGIYPGFATGREELKDGLYWCYDCRKWRLCRYRKFICRQLGRHCREPCDWCSQNQEEGWCSHE